MFTYDKSSIFDSILAKKKSSATSNCLRAVFSIKVHSMKKNDFNFQFLKLRTTPRNLRNALLVLLFGLTLTAYRVYNVNRYIEEQSKQEFGAVCDEIKAKISTRLRAHALLLRSGSALFSTTDSVSRKDWQQFIERTKIDENLPGVLGVGFSILIPNSQIQQHIQNIRKEGFPDYTIRPAGNRPVYTSVIFLEPFSGRNLRAFGYDMLTDSVRRKAVEQSRDFDIASLSGKVTLVQETQKDAQPGTLMYVPVYKKGMPVSTIEQRRAAIKGWVYSPFRMIDLMHDILGRWDLKPDDRIHLQVYDNSISKNSLLYDSQRNDTLNHTDSPSRNAYIPIDFNGKKWILHFTKTHEPFLTEYSLVVNAVIGGLVLSLLLFWLSLSLFNTRYRARQIADKLTAEIKESEERFRMLLNSAAEAIYGLDLEGNCTYANTACLQLLGYEQPEQLLGKNMHLVIHHSHADGSPFEIKDCRIHQSFIHGKGAHVDNEVFWRKDRTFFQAEYWSYPTFVKGKIAGAVVTFFDITDSKQANDILKASEEKFRKLFENTPLPLIVFDAQEKITFRNERFTAITGYTKEDVTNLVEWQNQAFPDIDYRLEANHKWEALKLSASDKGSDMNPEEYQVSCKDGTVRHMMLYGIFINDSFLVFFMDITHIRKAEEQIRKLSVAIEQSPSIIVITDTRGDIEYVNPQFTLFTGYTFEEVKGKNPRFLNSGRMDKNVFSELWKTISSGEIWKGEFINKKKNGDEFIESALIAPVLDENQKIINYIAIKDDITDKKELEGKLIESELHYRLIAENVNDEIWVFNMTEQRFTYISPSVLSIRGYTVEEAMSQDREQSLTPQSAQLLAELVPERRKLFIENNNRENVYVDQIQQPCKNGDIIWVEASTRYRYNAAGDIESVGISRNIDSRKKLEEEILKQNQQLTEANATKDKFFSIIAHDLRNPFNSILGFSELLLKNIDKFDNEKIVRFVNTINSTGKSTYKLLENLLEWSRSQTGKIEFKPEDFILENLLIEVVDLSNNAAASKNITLSYEITDSLIAFADRNMINTVLRNLISNAIKFTNRNGSITITAKKHNNRIETSVKDSGVGMSKTAINSLFKISEKAGTLGTENEQGTGLGLILCQEFITKHQENIWVESEVGKGSEFKFTLPFSTS